MKLLLTGFEPFGGSKINPSEQVVRALARENLGAIKLSTVILPVDRVHGPAALIRAYEEHQPDAVLCLGEASKRMAISIERVAINLLDFRLADNAGNQTVDEPIVRDAPAAYFVTLPVRAMLNAVHACGVPAELSLSAGAFLCNQVTYALLHYLAQEKLKTPAGFVHLPALPEQVIDKQPLIPSMSLETMLQGINAAIGAIESSKEKHV
jgi:pyroglutamyl-peptidase